jgi:N-dimethylarginine dimethylaminohydrolase
MDTERVLMCAPRFAPALSGEHSWVQDAEPLQPALALEQWTRLRTLVEAHIAPVENLQPEPWAPAMTFTRDLALATDDVVIPLMPESRRGPFEAPLAHRRLSSLGVDCETTHEVVRFDGGNVLADTHGRLLIGVSSESTDGFIETVRFLEAATGRAAYRVPLTGGRFPHIDMALCDLGGRAWLVYPDALPGFDLADEAWSTLFMERPVITVKPADGEQLACNLIVHRDVALGPEISPTLRTQLNQCGIHYVGTPLSKLLKAGGGALCLTLQLPR